VSLLTEPGDRKDKGILYALEFHGDQLTKGKGFRQEFERSKQGKGTRYVDAGFINHKPFRRGSALGEWDRFQNEGGVGARKNTFPQSWDKWVTVLNKTEGRDEEEGR